MSNARKYFGFIDLIILFSALVLWMFGEEWGRLAQHFSNKIWPLLFVLYVTLFSPIYGLITFIVAFTRYRSNKSHYCLVIFRFIWMFVITVNFFVFLSVAGAFK